MSDSIPSKRFKRSKQSVRTAQQLLEHGLVPEASEELDSVCNKFAVAISPAMQQQIDSASNDDPVAKQFVPDVKELNIQESELPDPIGDLRHSPLPGLVHRYPDRVLLKPVSVCPVYCRFCFRREKVGPGNAALTPQQLDAAFEYIEQHKEIWEVILTGGDPLIMKPQKLAQILKRLEAIEHVAVVRIHTRVPVVAPEKISFEMLQALQLQHKPTYIVLHANHANEFSSPARAACAMLANNGLLLLSQTVLLHGVNDNLSAMQNLLRTFVKNKIKPYYLHHLDLAKGTSHFRVSVAKGQELMRKLRGTISGVCMPTYVLDVPGGYGKVPIDYCYLQRLAGCNDAGVHYVVEDCYGKMHDYHCESGL